MEEHRLKLLHLPRGYMLMNNLKQTLIESTCEMPYTGALNMPRVMSSVQYNTL